jgi:hypothetical protein
MWTAPMQTGNGRFAHRLAGKVRFSMLDSEEEEDAAETGDAANFTECNSWRGCYMMSKKTDKAKTITLEVDLSNYKPLPAGKAKTITLVVEDTDYIHVVKNKIEDKVGSRGDPADYRGLIFEGRELEDGSTLADHHDIKNFSIISMQKHRIVFGMKWVDVGDKVPKSLTEIKWPDLEALVSEGLKIQGVGKGVIDLAQDAFRVPILWLDKGNTKPNRGRELKNPTLSDALKLKKEFTSQELTTFGIKDFCVTDYVQSDSSYFQPMTLLEKGVVDLAQDAFRERASEILTLTRILWLDMGSTQPNQGRELKNRKLSDALKLKKELPGQELTTFELTGQDLTKFGIQDFCMTDYVKVGSSYFQPAPGLSFSRMPIWQKHDTKPKKGRELNNQELKDHSINAFLATVTSDDNLRAGQELTTLGIQDLLMDDYIKNYGGGYFQAKTLTENHCIKVGSRYDGRMT